MIEAGGVICGRMPGGHRHGRQPLHDDLAGVADLGLPVELDIDHVHPLARLAANRLHAGRAEDGRLDGQRDQRFDLLGRQAGAFGQDDDARPVEVGEHVDRDRRRQVAAVDQHDERMRRGPASDSGGPGE